MASSVLYAINTNVDATSNGRNNESHAQSLHTGVIETDLQRHTP